MYQNVTGYFNTYYNARRLFDEAVGDARLQSQKDRDTNCFVRYTVPQNTQDKFDKVIEKSSKLIQFYPKSKWVDDAILMIGESYVYLGEYESAARKFKELLDHFPTSDLRFEAKLWDAKAKYFLNEHDAALTVIKDLFPDARAEGKNDVLLETLMLQARIFAERSEYDQAAASYALAAEVSGDDGLRASSEYLLGQSYERMDNKVKAAEAYGKVHNFDPQPFLDFQSRLRYGSMLAATGEHGRALKIFDDMNQDQLTVEQHGLVDLEIGNTYLAMGDTAQAFSLYNMIDSTYKHTEAAARSFYRRGRMYEEQRSDFKSARDYYNKAKVEFQSSDVTPLAARKSEHLDHYFNTVDGLKKYRSLYVQALYRDSVMAAGHAPHRALSGGRPDLAVPSDQAGGMADSTHRWRAPGPLQIPGLVYPPPDVVKEQLQPPSEETPHGASETLRRRLSDRDLFRDENEEAATPSNPEGAGVKPTAAAGTPSAKKDSLLISSANPSGGPAVEISQDSASALLAGAYFELGGIQYLELNRPDSAMACYGKIVGEYSATSFVPRALYAMAEIQGARHNSAAADSLYKIILSRYGESEYAAQVRKVLGIEATKARIDTSESQYREAENLVQTGKPDAALKIFKRIATAPQRSPLKPKATYAVGWLYETVYLNNDSAAEWYRNLSSKYPASIYAAEVKPKIAVRDNPEYLKQYINVKAIAPAAKYQDSVSQKQPQAEPARQLPKQTAIDRIKARQQDELKQGNADDTPDEEDTQQDEDDQSDNSDDNN